MKILALFILLVSFTAFAKPSISYKYIPKDANVVGYVSTKSLMKSKYFKKFIKTKNGKEALKNLKKIGVNIKKLGSVFFYSNSDKVLASENPKDVKNLDYAIVLNGINLKTFVEKIANKNKNAKIINHGGFKIYNDLEKQKNEQSVEAITFIKGNSILGSVTGIKKVIDAFSGKSKFAKKSIVNGLYSKLGNPDAFIINIINEKQKIAINKALQKNQANPAMMMLGIPALSKNAEYFGLAFKLKGSTVTVKFGIKANKASIKMFTTALNMQFKNFKPMIMQQIDAYSGMVGKTGSKELKSIVNSLRITQKKDLGIISFKVNLNNVEKIINQMNKAQKGQKNQNDQMMQMMKQQQMRTK